MNYSSIIHSVMGSEGVKVTVEKNEDGRVVAEVFRPVEGAYLVRKVREYELVRGTKALVRITLKLFESVPSLGTVVRWVEELDVLENRTRSQPPDEYKRRKGTLEDIPEGNKEAKRISRDISRLRTQQERLRKEIQGLEVKLARVLSPIEEKVDESDLAPKPEPIGGIVGAKPKGKGRPR